MTVSETLLGISNSEIQTWKRCRRRWWLAYVRHLGLSPDDAPLADVMTLGQRVHDALEAYYGHGEDPLKVEQEIYEAGRLLVTERDSETLLRNYDGDHEYAKRMISGYLQWATDEGIDADYEVIGAEQEVRVPSGVDGVFLRGKLDVRLRRRTDGRRLFMDHKTAGSLDHPTLDINEQFPTYGLLERLAGLAQGRHVEGGIVNVLKRVKRTFQAKPPFYRRIEIRFNDHQLRVQWTRMHAVIIEILRARVALDTGIDHQEVVYPTPTGDCHWSCPFFKICHLFDDGSRVEDAISSLYVTVDPYARYEVRSAE